MAEQSHITGFKFVGELKWRDVTFLYISSSISGSRKTSIKKFVNTGDQFVEDLGKDQRSHSIKAMVAPLRSDEEFQDPNITTSNSIRDLQYIQKRDALLDAIDTPDAGTLVHPMYGPIEDLVVTSFTLTEKVTELGIGQITIDFEVSNAFGEPKISEVALDQISADTQDVLDKASSSIGNSFSTLTLPKTNIISTLLTNLMGVYDSAVDKITAMGDKIASAVKFSEKAKDQLEAVNQMVSDIQEHISVIAADADALKKVVKNTFNTINGTISSATATFDLYKNFYKFGYIDDIRLLFKTKSIQQTNTNNATINNAFNCNALAGSYLAVAQKDYKTTNEIDEDILVLEEQMNAILDAPELDNNLLISILNARQNINTFLEQKKLTVSKIITIETGLTSARSLSYLYYGDDSEGVSIAKLNVTNGLMMQGNVEIFSK